MFRDLFDSMRQGLAVAVDALDPIELEQVAQKSRSVLKEPWAISAEEQYKDLNFLNTLVVGLAAGKHDRVVRVSARSGLAHRLVKLAGMKIPLADRELLLEAMLAAAAKHQVVRQFSVGSLTGWRLAPGAVRLRPGEGKPDNGRGNAFFAGLYADVAARLGTPGDLPMAFEAREHTAQVDALLRELRECRFRFGTNDKIRMAEMAGEARVINEKRDFLPLLYCSPTMELGVDISQLNVVYMRNAPPTPANYAQRAGRAGRSGQAALVVTYCAAQSPHDQYYFERRIDLVAGIVKAPAIDLVNADLLSPLYDLAEINVGHYRNSADYEDAAYLCGQPQIFMAGLDDHWVKMLEEKGIYFGSRAILPLPVNGSAGILQAQLTCSTPRTPAAIVCQQPLSGQAGRSSLII